MRARHKIIQEFVEETFTIMIEENGKKSKDLEYTDESKRSAASHQNVSLLSLYAKSQGVG